MKDTRKLIATTIIPQHLYVRRDADRRIEANISSMGRPAYVLVSRQMGKTNLLLNTKRLLESDSQIFGYVDLSTKFSTARECFRNFVDSIVQPHGQKLGSAGSIIAKQRQTSELAPHKEFEYELLVLLRHFPGKVIMILDEIDALIDTTYSDEIFAQIRSIYFTRINYREFERLTFLLSGVAEPSLIIKDRTKSPFNIGEKIYLDDFSSAEFKQLLISAELKFPTDVQDYIFQRVEGHPRMTWDVCSALEEVFGMQGAVSKLDVDAVIKTLYLERFDTPPVDHIRDLARSDRTILRAIKQIYHDPSLPLADVLRKKLYLAGIIPSEVANIPLRIKNSIIQEALGPQWLDSIESFGHALAFMGDEQRQLRNYSVAIRHYWEYLNRDDVKDHKIRITVITSIAECHQSLEEWDKALDLFEQCNFDRNECPQEYGKVMLNKGFCLFAKDNFTGAAKVFESLIETSKRGIIKWKACVNFASTLHQSESDNALDRAITLYEQVLSETEDFDEELTSDLRAISFFNLAQIHAKRKASEKAKLFLNSALIVANKSFHPDLLLSLLEVEEDPTEAEKLLTRATDVIVSNRLDIKTSRPSTLVTPDMAFNRGSLRGVLIEALDRKCIAQFEKLSEYSRSHYLTGIKSDLGIVLWLYNTDEEKSESTFLILESALKSGTIKTNRIDTLHCYRELAFAKRQKNLSYFNDLREYMVLFGREPITADALSELDLVAFIVAIIYLRDHRESKGGLEFSRIILPYYDIASKLQSEFAPLFCLAAQLTEQSGSRKEALLLAERASAILKTRDPNKSTIVMATPEADAIKKVVQGIILRTSAIPSVRTVPKVGRNDRCPCGSGKKYKHCCWK